MRKASLLMIAILALSAALGAQQTSDTNSQARTLSAGPAQTQHEADARDNTCYTMRSYLFARRDGEAPRLVGMTTCTPAGQFRTYHAQQKPRFGLYPATASPPSSGTDENRDTKLQQ